MQKLLWALILVSNYTLAGKCTNASEIVLSPQQEEQYLASLTNNNVVFVRSLLNRYLSNKGDQNFDINSFKKLKAYDKSKYKGRFILSSYHNSVGNTAVVQIIFQERPDGIYEAIVANQNKLLSWEFIPYGECGLKNVHIAYRKFLTEEAYGF